LYHADKVAAKTPLMIAINVFRKVMLSLLKLMRRMKRNES
jgi:hypothetical protein